MSLVVYLVLSAITVSYSFARTSYFGVSSSITSWYHKVLWVLFTISTESAVGISLLFWKVLYQPESDIICENIIQHLLNGVIACIDLWITGFPVRMHHSCLIMIFGFTYSAFAFAILGPLVIAPSIHIVFYGCYILREAIFKKCLYRDEEKRE